MSVETIVDIVAEKRARAREMEKTLGDQHSFVESLKQDADRIEAAWKLAMSQSWHHREMAELVSRHEKELSDARRATGNSAEMHDALKKVSRWLEGGLAYCHRRRVGEVVQVPAISGFHVLDAVNAALANPPRNCDALSKEEALAELDSRSFSKEDTIEWLYAVKGETDGSK